MALQKTLLLSNHLTATDAYIRVDTVAGSKGGITASVNIYLSRAAFLGLAPFTRPASLPDAPGGTEPDPQGFLEQVMLDFVPDVSASAPHFIAQTYASLKALPRFAGAVDV